MARHSWTVRATRGSAEDRFYAALQAHAGTFRGGLKDMVAASHHVASWWLKAALEAKYGVRRGGRRTG